MARIIDEDLRAHSTSRIEQRDTYFTARAVKEAMRKSGVPEGGRQNILYFPIGFGTVVSAGKVLASDGEGTYQLEIIDE